MYGFLRGLLETLDKARHEGRPWVYADRGYFRASQGDDYSGYFRLTRNAYQHHGRGYFPRQRWDRLAIRMHPWRRGRHILVCPPGEVFMNGVGTASASVWLDSTLKGLKAHTDRPIKIRHKPRPGQGTTLIQDLQGAHALVTYMSNTAVEAVIEGVPVFCSPRSAAAVVGKTEVAEIESPAYPDRDAWAAALASNQWTLAELRAGMANHLFKEME